MAETQRAITPHAAIEALRAEVLRCFDCGRAHKYRPNPGRPGMWTWADPDDGHAYRHMSSDEVRDWLFTDAAEAVLVGVLLSLPAFLEAHRG